MAGLRRTLVYLLRRGGRRFLDFLSDLVCRVVYRNDKRALPPISCPLLLEPATQLAEKIRKGQLKSRDVVEAFISRIEEVHPILNIIVDQRFEEARAEALAVDQLVASGTRSQEELARDFPFLGIPFTAKNSLGIKGLVQDVGLASRRGSRAPEDAAIVSALRKAGAIPLALTNVSEVCLWWEANNTIYGRSRNPYDTRRGVGGSSGGEGALLASAGSVIGLGNDIGGSIRIPAFFNGVFGHKPTAGVVSNAGQYPEPTGDLKSYLTAGPMCRFATDLTPLLRVMASSMEQLTLLRLDEPVDISGLKVFFMKDDGGNPCVSPMDRDLSAAFDRVLKYLAEVYHVVPRKVDINLKHGALIWGHKMIAGTEVKCSQIMGGEKGEFLPYRELVKWIVGLSKHTFPAIGAALVEELELPRVEKRKFLFQLYDTIVEKFEEILQENCVFLYPTLPEPAPFHNQPLFQMHNCNYLGIFNILGYPVTQCPLGLTSQGLPIGIQVVANKYQDRLTLALAQQLEREFGGWVDPSSSSSAPQTMRGCLINADNDVLI